MLRRSSLLLVGLVLLLPGHLRAADPLMDAMSAVPKDAVLVVCTGNIQHVEGRFQYLIKALGLTELLQPPWDAPSGVLAEYLRVGDQLRKDAPLLVFYMPAPTPVEFNSNWVVVLPVKDSRAGLEAIGAEAGEGDVWTATYENMPVYVVPADERLVFSANPDAARTAAESKEGLVGQLADPEKQMFEGMDVAFWINGEKLIKLFRLQIDGFLNMMMMMQAGQGGSGPLAQKQMETSKKNVKLLLDGTQSFGIGLAMKDDGLVARGGFVAKPNTELAEKMDIPEPSAPLLEGLPADDFMLVISTAMSAKQMKQQLEMLDPYLEAAKEMEEVDNEKIARFRELAEEWAPLNEGVHLIANALTPGPDGILGIAAVVVTKDSARWMELAREAAALKLDILSSEGLIEDPELKGLVDAASHTADAEEVAGLKLDHATIDLTTIEALEEEDVENIQAVIGNEGAVFRFGAVGEKRVVMTVGGGSKYCERIIELVKKEGAPLAESEDIKQVCSHLPEQRYSIGFLALDQILDCVASGVRVIEDDEFPIRMKDVPVPVAMSGSGKDNFSRGDFFIPTPVMVAGKDTAMMALGMFGGQAQMQMQTEPESDDAPAEETEPEAGE